MYICMHVWMYVYMYMYVCMHVYAFNLIPLGLYLSMLLWCGLRMPVEGKSTKRKPLRIDRALCLIDVYLF